MKNGIAHGQQRASDYLALNMNRAPKSGSKLRALQTLSRHCSRPADSRSVWSASGLPALSVVQARARRKKRGESSPAFTLIEMLVVIAIIAILAALVVNILPAAGQRKVRNRVTTEMHAIETAINTYHQKRGFYPPDNKNNEAQPPLFYELTGTEWNPQNDEYTDIFRTNILRKVDVQSYFAIDGFLNSAEPDKPGSKQNFFPNLNLRGSADLPGSTPPARLLAVPYKGPNTPPNGPGGDPNFWHYSSSNPRYNSDSYDLWADVVIGGKTITIGNWK